MPVSRMRMRPWLEDMLDSSSIAGLVWLDKEKKIFSIPWKHAARHGWEMEKDACLFKQWAVHTGKYKAGISNVDPKTWKANFRCALNSLPDIEEVKDRSINKGCGAVRVYRMLQTVAKNRDKRSRTKDVKTKNKNKAAIKEEVPEQSDASHQEDQNTEATAQADSTQDLATDIFSYFCSTDEESSDMSNPQSIHSLLQVSPYHSPDYDKVSDYDPDTELFQIAQYLENEHNNRYNLQSNIIDSTDSANSPESHWSDASAQDVELRLYTELRSNENFLLRGDITEMDNAELYGMYGPRPNSAITLQTIS